MKLEIIVFPEIDEEILKELAKCENISSVHVSFDNTYTNLIDNIEKPLVGIFSINFLRKNKEYVISLLSSKTILKLLEKYDLIFFDYKIKDFGETIRDYVLKFIFSEKSWVRSFYTDAFIVKTELIKRYKTVSNILLTTDKKVKVKFIVLNSKWKKFVIRDIIWFILQDKHILSRLLIFFTDLLSFIFSLMLAVIISTFLNLNMYYMILLFTFLLLVISIVLLKIFTKTFNIEESYLKYALIKGFSSLTNMFLLLFIITYLNFGKIFVTLLIITLSILVNLVKYYLIIRK